MMRNTFGKLPDGREAHLYTIACGKLRAELTDFGATLVRLYVPDRDGNTDDIVLGYDDVNGYATSTTYFGATVGRNANRVKAATFRLNGKQIDLCTNDGINNLHSGPDGYSYRIWNVAQHLEDAITFTLESPDGDQGFPGKASIRVTYALTPAAQLKITYDAISDKDTVFNLTNHSYFNLAGHKNTHLAMAQELMLPARHFTPDDAESIPTGEKRDVTGTPMDFRIPKAIGRDIDADYDALDLQGGYDHNFEVFCNPCAILHESTSGRTMAVYTDCPGIQFYSGNYLNDHGKDGVFYAKRTGIALETQFYPDSVNHSDWIQPITKAGQRYHSETTYHFI